MRIRRTRNRLVGAGLIWLGLASIVAAAPPSAGGVRLNDLLGGRKPAGALFDQSNDQPPVVRAALVPATAKKGDTVTLSVTVNLPLDSHTYSTTQPDAGATVIDISEVEGLEPKGDFQSDHPPESSIDALTKKPVEKLPGGATWLRQYVMTADRSENVRIGGKIELKYCNATMCRPFSQSIRARLVDDGSKGELVADAEAADVLKSVANPPGGRTRLTFTLSPAHPKPKAKVTLSIHLRLDKGWHTYSTTRTDEIGSIPTTIELESGKGLRPIGGMFQADRSPQKTPPVAGLGPKEIFEDEVTWHRRFQYEPQGADTGLGIKGTIRYQVCNDATCLTPKKVPFSLGDLKGADKLPAALPEETVAVVDAAEEGLWLNLGTLFLGGMLMNIMPCVLPVLAIKVLSFVQQAGQRRSRIFLLNVAYTIGVLAVFLSLATLAVGARLGLTFVGDFSWGGLFQQTGFNLVMACVVFAMGLSLLGVFEIPVPGMVGAAAGSAHQEGFLGAFLTGILATLLATPCLGPFMGTALWWSVRQPTHLVYLTWGVLGLGMASPYLVLGLFPQLTKWLPKPGTWMVRFKEFAGFVLLGSVIFIVYYTDKKFTVPLLVMLLGVALGLWMIGNLYDVNSQIRHKMAVRLSALILTGLICWFGYGLAADSEYRLAWEPFSEARVSALLKEKKGVLVDFTADWCLNCHVNEYLALNTKEAQDVVNRYGITTLLADFTNQSDEIKRWLLKFQQVGVPLTVIFPAGKPEQPIVLRGVYSKGMLVEKLKEAAGKSSAETAGLEAEEDSSTTR